MLQGLLRGEGLQTGRRQVATLMKKMAIEAMYLRSNVETGTWAQNLSLPPAQAGDYKAQPNLGHGLDL